MVEKPEAPRGRDKLGPDGQPGTPLEAALEYAALGIPVFPVWWVDGESCACGDADCDSPGKHPITASGLKDATTSEKTVRRYWGRYPKAGVAGVCGKESGFIALDVDPRHGGDESLADLEEIHGPLPPGPRSRTGGGGEHYFFKHPGGHVPKSTGFALGLDLQADRSYVLLPPSGHVSGGVYGWEEPLQHPEKLPFPPGWLLKAAATRPAKEKTAPGKDEPVPEGQRNVALTSIAGSLRRVGASEETILTQLRQENTARCRPPLPDREVEAIAKSVARYEPGEVEEHVPEDVPRDLAARREAEEMDLKGAIETLKKLEAFPDGSAYLRQILWVTHAYLIGLFNATWYLNFDGPRNAGKTTATEVSIFLSPNGIMLVDTTDASLSAILDEGRVLGIDEADTLLKSHAKGIIPGLLRSGYTRGAVRTLRVAVPGAKKGETQWITEEQSIFGPKVLNCHSSLEPALASRTDTISMKPSNDPDLAINNLLRARYLHPVLIWLKNETKNQMEGWDREAMDDFLDSEEFRKKVRALPGDFGRDFQIGGLMLATAHIMGWESEMQQVIEGAITQRKTLDEWSLEAEVLEEVLEILRERHGVESNEELLKKGVSPDFYITTENLLFRINEKRKTTGQKWTLTYKPLGAALRDLGFEKPDTKNPGTWKKITISGEDRNKWGVYPSPLLTHLAQVAQVAQIDSQTGMANAPDAPDAPVSKGGSIDESREGEIRRFIKTNAGRTGVPLTALLHEFKELSPSNAKEILSGLMDQKKVAEIRREVFKVLGSKTAKEVKEDD